MHPPLGRTRANGRNEPLTQGRLSPMVDWRRGLTPAQQELLLARVAARRAARAVTDSARFEAYARALFPHLLPTAEHIEAEDARPLAPDGPA